MIRVTPRYTVSYKGVFYKAGAVFIADGDDREELARHGHVEDMEEAPTAPQEDGLLEDSPPGPLPAKKPGRPRKQEALDG